MPVEVMISGCQIRCYLSMLRRLGNEEMGHDASPTRRSWDMYPSPSGASSFEEQLWAELDAHARRRRSTEGAHTPAARPVPSCPAAAQGAASPFAPQAAPQGAISFFSQVPPCQHSAPGRAGPMDTPSSTMPSLAAAAQQRASAPALPSATAAAPAVQADSPSYVVASAKAEPPGSMASPFAAVAQHAASQAAVPAALSRPPAGAERQKAATAAPMGLDELGRLNKRPKRRPLLQHKMTEMLAALDAKSQSSSGSANNGQDKTPEHCGALLAAKPGAMGQFPKALSEECPAACPSLSNLLDVQSVSQSVPEQPPPAQSPGMFNISADILEPQQRHQEHWQA